MPKDLRTTWGIGAPPRDVLAGVTAQSHVTAVCPRLFREMLRELRSGEFRPLDAFDVIKVEDTTPTLAPSLSPAVTQVPTVNVPTFWRFEGPEASGSDRTTAASLLTMVVPCCIATRLLLRLSVV